MNSNSYRSVLLLVAVVAFSSLCLEVTLTRLFSVIFFYHFTFLTLSVAFIGASGAGLVAWLLGERLLGEKGDRLLAPLTLMCGLSMMALLPLIKSQAFIEALIEASPLRLIPALLLITLPYFLVSLILCMAFASNASRIGATYAADLVAAAVGCVVFPLVIGSLGGAASVMACGTAVLITLVVLPSSLRVLTRSKLLAERAVRVVVIVLAFAATVYVHLSPSWEIRPRIARDSVGGPQIERIWSSVSSLGVYPLGDATTPTDRFLLIDSLYGTPLLDLGDQPASEHGAFAEASIFDVPFTVLSDSRSIAILGAGAGIDVIRARNAGFERVVGIEVNPAIVDVVQSGRYSQGLARFLSQEGVTYSRDEARAWLASTESRWQVIQIPWIESKAAVTGGALAFSENLLFTVEAFRLYLSRLEDDGLLVINRYSHATEPPLQMLRLVSLLQETLGTSVSLTNHVAIVALQSDELGYAVLLYSVNPFSQAQITTLLEQARALNLRVDYVPGFPEGNQYLQAALSGPEALGRITAELPNDISATTDERPYFFRTTHAFGSDRTNNELFGVLTAVGILAVLFLVLPLVRVGSDSLRQAGSGRILFYFVAIGYGFMATELTLLHRLMLVLGRPETTLIVVLAALLFSSGVGSWFSSRLAGSQQFSIRRLALITSLMVVLFTAGFDSLAVRLETASFPVRVLVAVGCVFPFGLLMGTFFPRAVGVLNEKAPSLIPWAWSMNGLASVAGSAATLYFSLNMGMTLAAVPAALAYFCVAFTAPAEQPVG